MFNKDFLGNLELDPNVKESLESEIPKCLICIDSNQHAHLIEVLNLEKAKTEILETINDILTEYEMDEDPGVYVMEIGQYVSQSYNPEFSDDYNVDLTFNNIRKIKINLKEKIKK